MGTDRREEVSRLVRAMLGTALFLGGLFVRFNSDGGSNRDFAALVLGVVGATLVLAVWDEVFSSSNTRDVGRPDPVLQSKARARIARFIERYW